MKKKREPVSDNPTSRGGGRSDPAFPAELEQLISDSNTRLRQYRHTDENLIFIQILPVVFHKLKNHLTPILGYSQLLQKKTADSGILSRLAKISNNADLLLTRFDTLMDSFPPQKMSFLPLDINPIIRDLPELLTASPPGKGAEIHLDLQKGLPPVPLSADHFRLVIRELIRNARQAIRIADRKSGIITVRTSGTGSGVAIGIEDNGCGILPESRDQVFEVFFSDFKSGAGLGLPFCEKIIQSHGGRISLQSTPDRGTRVDIYLPGSSSESGTRESRRILLVGSHQPVFRYLADFLEDFPGLEIVRTLDEKSALDRLARENFDLVVTWLPYHRFEDIQLASGIPQDPAAGKLLVIGTAEPEPGFLCTLRTHGIYYLPGPPRLYAIIQKIYDKLISQE